MGMYSYFVMAQPANLKIDLSLIPKHLLEYFFGSFLSSSSSSSSSFSFEKEEITFEEFGKKMERMKLLGYLNQDNFNKWRELFVHLQKEQDKEDKTIIRMHFFYEEDQMFFIQALKNGQVDFFVGKYSDSQYFVSNHIVERLVKYEPSAKNEFYSYHHLEENEENEKEVEREEQKEIDVYKTCVHIPSYLTAIKNSEHSKAYSVFSKIDVKKLGPDPVYLLFNSGF